MKYVGLNLNSQIYPAMSSYKFKRWFVINSSLSSRDTSLVGPVLYGLCREYMIIQPLECALTLSQRRSY